MFYDTLTGAKTMISLPLPADGGWGGGRVLLTDAATPAHLVAHYPLDGDAADVSGYAHVRTIFGATPTTDRFGTPDSAYSLDGENDHIVIDLRSQLETDAVSIAAWVKMNDAADPRPVGEWWDIVSYGGLGMFLRSRVTGRFLVASKAPEPPAQSREATPCSTATGTM